MLIVLAVLCSGLGYLVGLRDGGWGWISGGPVLGGLAGFLLSFLAAVLAIVHLVRVRAGLATAWLVLVAALLAGAIGCWVLGQWVQAVNAV